MAENVELTGVEYIATEQVGDTHYHVVKLEPAHRAALLEDIRHVVLEAMAGRADAPARGYFPGDA